jgi:hypothetical protein
MAPLTTLPPTLPVFLPPQSDSGVLLTTYETMRLQRGDLLGVEWGYVVLDEGHTAARPAGGGGGGCVLGIHSIHDTEPSCSYQQRRLPPPTSPSLPLSPPNTQEP